MPTQKLTCDQLDILKINDGNFLWPEEEKLFIMVFTNNQKVLAFKDSEQGRLSRDYFSDYIMPVVKHVPWNDPPIPIPQPTFKKFAISLRPKSIPVFLN